MALSWMWRRRSIAHCDRPPWWTLERRAFTASEIQFSARVPMNDRKDHFQGGMVSTQENPLAKVIAQAWSDEDYKRRLVDDPAGALAEAGAEVPDAVQLRVVEDSDTLKHLVIPAAPGQGEINEEDLERVSGGTVGSYVCFGGGQ
jgi:hypothetical protein